MPAKQFRKPYVTRFSNEFNRELDWQECVYDTNPSFICLAKSIDLPQNLHPLVWHYPGQFSLRFFAVSLLGIHIHNSNPLVSLMLRLGTLKLFYTRPSPDEKTTTRFHCSQRTANNTLQYHPNL